MLAAVAAVLIFLSFANVVAWAWFDRRIVNVLDLDGEHGIPAYFTSLLLVVSAALAFGIAVAVRRAGRPRWLHWAVLGALLLLVGLDESLVLHERLIVPLREGLDAGGILYFAWVIPGVAVVAILAAAYGRLVWELPGRVRTLLVLAAVCYVGGALGLEMVSGALAAAGQLEDGGIPYQFLINVEEALELTGLLLLIRSLSTYLGSGADRESAPGALSVPAGVPSRA